LGKHVAVRERRSLRLNVIYRGLRNQWIHFRYVKRGKND